MQTAAINKSIIVVITFLVQVSAAQQNECVKLLKSHLGEAPPAIVTTVNVVDLDVVGLNEIRNNVIERMDTYERLLILLKQRYEKVRDAEYDPETELMKSPYNVLFGHFSAMVESVQTAEKALKAAIEHFKSVTNSLPPVSFERIKQIDVEAERLRANGLGFLMLSYDLYNLDNLIHLRDSDILSEEERSELIKTIAMVRANLSDSPEALAEIGFPIPTAKTASAFQKNVERLFDKVTKEITRRTQAKGGYTDLFLVFAYIQLDRIFEYQFEQFFKAGHDVSYFYNYGIHSVLSRNSAGTGINMSRLKMASRYIYSQMILLGSHAKSAKDFVNVMGRPLDFKVNTPRESGRLRILYALADHFINLNPARIDFLRVETHRKYEGANESHLLRQVLKMFNESESHRDAESLQEQSKYYDKVANYFSHKTASAMSNEAAAIAKVFPSFEMTLYTVTLLEQKGYRKAAIKFLENTEQHNLEIAYAWLGSSFPHLFRARGVMARLSWGQIIRLHTIPKKPSLLLGGAE